MFTVPMVLIKENQFMSSKQIATMTDVLREIQLLPVYVRAQQAKVDVENVIRTHWVDHLEGYTLQTAVTYAIGYLTDEIDSAMDAPLKGLVVGQRDVYGKNIPLTYPLLSSDGQHKRLVASESTRIEVGSALVELKGSYKPDYKNYQITARTTVTPLTPEDTVKKLLQIAVPVTGINFSRLEKYGVIVVTGMIRWVYAAARFQDGAKVGSHSVWLPTEDTAPQRFVPVVDLSLDKEGGTLGVTVSLTRQKHAHPVFEVTDLEMICSRAARDAPDPQMQATLVKNGLAGRHVVVVGEIGYLKQRDEGNLVILNAFAIYQYDPKMVGTGTLPQTAAPAPAYPPVQPPVTAAAGGAYVPPPGTKVYVMNEAPQAQAPPVAAAPLPDGWIGPAPDAVRRDEPPVAAPRAAAGLSPWTNTQVEAEIRRVAALQAVAPDAVTLEMLRATGSMPVTVPDGQIASVLRIVTSMAAAMRGESNDVEWAF